MILPHHHHVADHVTDLVRGGILLRIILGPSTHVEHRYRTAPYIRVILVCCSFGLPLICLFVCLFVSDTPDFTACFLKTVLSWTPMVVLFLLGPLELRQCLRSKDRNIPWNWLNISKLVVTIGLIAVAIAQLVIVMTEEDTYEV